eukprot:8557922-Prorocentrum_lima.AAC.1
MTSSLVGSEMCIRDRASMTQLAMRAFLKLSCWAADTSVGTCLLYTSDAADDADDMQCVDLGGR